MQGTDK